MSIGSALFRFSRMRTHAARRLRHGGPLLDACSFCSRRQRVGPRPAACRPLRCARALPAGDHVTLPLGLLPALDRLAGSPALDKLAQRKLELVLELGRSKCPDFDWRICARQADHLLGTRCLPMFLKSSFSPRSTCYPGDENARLSLRQRVDADIGLVRDRLEFAHRSRDRYEEHAVQRVLGAILLGLILQACSASRDRDALSAAHREAAFFAALFDGPRETCKQLRRALEAEIEGIRIAKKKADADFIAEQEAPPQQPKARWLFRREDPLAALREVAKKTQRAEKMNSELKERRCRTVNIEQALK